MGHFITAVVAFYSVFRANVLKCFLQADAVISSANIHDDNFPVVDTRRETNVVLIDVLCCINCLANKIEIVVFGVAVVVVCMCLWAWCVCKFVCVVLSTFHPLTNAKLVCGTPFTAQETLQEVELPDSQCLCRE